MIPSKFFMTMHRNLITPRQLNWRGPSFSSSTSSSPPASAGKRKRYARTVAIGTIVIVVPTAGVGVHVRKERRQKLELLPKASTLSSQPGYLWYPKEALILNMERTGLMGQLENAKSVKEELDRIRQWHYQHGFRGGLVLRDLEQPLLGEEHLEDIVGDPMRRARRECYYLYYERTPSAEMRQEIFCRGTSLLVDMLTNLQAWYVYDEELDARIHLGFRNHADRLIQDVLPLLVQDKRATIQVNGHSLGGAVATIVALKLRKRGYNVTRLLTTASPRFCHQDAVEKLSPLLPEDTLRVEDDRDLVPLLPPFAAHLTCDKLWLMRDDVPRLIPKSNLPSWVDSVWINFLAPEILPSCGKRHRVSFHVKEVKKIE